jgi:CDP-diacylglycerol---serine O-phosphatidyltransferase
MNDRDAVPPPESARRVTGKRMKPVDLLPTAVTLGNLFSGFLAIAYLTDSMHVDPMMTASQADVLRVGLYKSAMWCILFAMIFDALDGKIARMTGSASEFGAQIDSLSDVVSFGAAPALLFKVMVEAKPDVVSPRLALILAVVYLACAALRLARFNVETDTSEEAHRNFKGLPSPAAASAVLTLSYLNLTLDPEHGQSWARWTMPVLVPLFGFLMVSRIPYVHLANRMYSERKKFRFLVGAVFVVATVLWKPEVMVPVAMAAYLASGPITWLRRRSQKPKGATPPTVDPTDEDGEEDLL